MTGSRSSSSSGALRRSSGSLAPNQPADRGTTQPFLARSSARGIDRETGIFHSPSGLAKCYRSTDNVKSDAYRGLSPEDLLDIMTINRLHYSQGTETGVLFHMIGAVSQFGKLGLTVIGNHHEQVDTIYERRSRR